MTENELMLAVAHIIRKDLGVDHVAILVDYTCNVLGIGTHSGDGGCQTAIANLVHAQNSAYARTRVYATYRPKNLCIGIAYTAGIKNVYYYHDRIYQWFTPNGPKGADQTDDSTQASGPFSSILEAVIHNTKNKAVTLKDLKLPVYKKLTEASWVQAARYGPRELPQHIGDAFAQVPKSPVEVSVELKHDLFMACAFAIVGRTIERKEDFKGHNIGAIMTDGSKIIAWGLNFHDENLALHAETSMILGYLTRERRETLPKPCYIYTTLEPCQMCSSLITDMGSEVQVFFGMTDPTLNDTTLRLQANGCTQKLFSMIEVQQGLQKEYEEYAFKIRAEREKSEEKKLTRKPGKGVTTQGVESKSMGSKTSDVSDSKMEKTEEPKIQIQKKQPQVSVVEFLKLAETKGTLSVLASIYEHCLTAVKLVGEVTLPGLPYQPPKFEKDK